MYGLPCWTWIRAWVFGFGGLLQKHGPQLGTGCTAMVRAIAPSTIPRAFLKRLAVGSRWGAGGISYLILNVLMFIEFSFCSWKFI